MKLSNYIPEIKVQPNNLTSKKFLKQIIENNQLPFLERVSHYNSYESYIDDTGLIDNETDNYVKEFVDNYLRLLKGKIFIIGNFEGDQSKIEFNIISGFKNCLISVVDDDITIIILHNFGIL